MKSNRTNCPYEFAKLKTLAVMSEALSFHSGSFTNSWVRKTRNNEKDIEDAVKIIHESIVKKVNKQEFTHLFVDKKDYCRVFKFNEILFEFRCARELLNRYYSKVNCMGLQEQLDGTGSGVILHSRQSLYKNQILKEIEAIRGPLFGKYARIKLFKMVISEYFRSLGSHYSVNEYDFPTKKLGDFLREFEASNDLSQ